MYNNFCRSREVTSHVSQDFCDGKVAHSHPLFSSCTNTLQLLFYYDDVEVVNPIGSHRKVHKLGTSLVMVYSVLHVHIIANRCVLLHAW